MGGSSHGRHPLRTATFVLIGSLAAGAGFATLLLRGAAPGGIDDVYTRLFGPPDLGPVDFPTLRRRSSPNDALACPQDVCTARTDVTVPDFPVDGERLRTLVKAVATADGAEHVFESSTQPQDRYVARTRLMRFPDTIDVLIVERDAGHATLALYSRSQIGRSDLGANRARLSRWIARLSARTAQP